MASFIHIVAMSQNGYIGVGDKLPFDVPEDLLNFKALTADSLICMGFNTFKSIADNYTKAGKPFLPGRKITVICSSAQKSIERTEAYKEFDNVLFLATNVFNQLVSRNRKPIIIVGGAKLYQTYRPSMIIATHVNMDVVVPTPAPVVAPVETTDPAAPTQAPVAPVVPAPVTPSYTRYPYFNELKKDFFGLSFASNVSKNGLEYTHTVYFGNY